MADRSAVTLDRIRVFLRVAERGSFSAVARETGLGQSTVTRQVRELEAALGVPLLSRTTRRVTLTTEGSAYHASIAPILLQLEQAGDVVRATGANPAGRVRVSCTAAFGVLHAARLVFAFQDSHPDIGVDLSLTDERVDLVQGGFDIALRLGPLSPSTMKLRRLGLSRRLLVASPAFLARHGRPATPQELLGLEGIRMSNVAGSERLHLVAQDGRAHVVPFGGRLRLDHGLAVREALLAGRGFAPAHCWLVDDLVKAGQLEAMLPDHALRSIPLSLLIVPERAAIGRVRTLIRFLVEQVTTVPGIDTRLLS